MSSIGIVEVRFSKQMKKIQNVTEIIGDILKVDIILGEYSFEEDVLYSWDFVSFEGTQMYI